MNSGTIYSNSVGRRELLEPVLTSFSVFKGFNNVLLS